MLFHSDEDGVLFRENGQEGTRTNKKGQENRNKEGRTISTYSPVSFQKSVNAMDILRMCLLLNVRKMHVRNFRKEI